VARLRSRLHTDFRAGLGDGLGGVKVEESCSRTAEDVGDLLHPVPHQVLLDWGLS